MMKIRPIRNDDDHAKALEFLEDLWGAPDGSEEADQKEILITLLDAYEEKHHPIDPPDPVEAILFRLEQRGLTTADLEPMIGTRSRVYEILNHKRPLTLSMIRKIKKALGIPAEILIQETAVQRYPS